jgi:hypothetical protein
MNGSPELRDLLAVPVGASTIVAVVVGTRMAHVVGAAGQIGAPEALLHWAADALAVPERGRRNETSREAVLLEDRARSTDPHRYAHVVGASYVVVATFIDKNCLDAVRLLVMGLAKRLEEGGAAWPS